MDDLKLKLKAKRMTPRMLAEATGLSESYLHRVLTRKATPSFKTANLIIACSHRAFTVKDFSPQEEN